MDMARKFIQIGLYTSVRKYQGDVKDIQDGKRKRVVLLRMNPTDAKSIIKTETAKIFWSG
jgi:hypothetical protein